MSPVRVSLNSDNTHAPLYLRQPSSIPKIGEGLLHSIRSFGDGLSEAPAFVMPSWTIQGGSRLSDLGDFCNPPKDSPAGLGAYFEGDNSSTPSCLSPRSVHSTDHGDDHCQAETSFSSLDVQKKLADRSVDALRNRLMH